MTTARAYRPAQTTSHAIAELWRYAGSQFDTEVVEAFVAAWSAMAVPEAQPAPPAATPSATVLPFERSDSGRTTRLGAAYFNVFRYVTSTSRSSGGRLRYDGMRMSGRAAVFFACCASGLTSHSRSSVSLSLPPTPSSGYFLLPLSPTEWHEAHFCAA